jgi:hypothetical protein
VTSTSRRARCCSTVDNLKLIVGLKLFFVTPLKDNRLVSLSPAGGYIHLQDLNWTPDRLAHRVSVKLKEIPFRVQLFKVVTPNGDLEWGGTNHPAGSFTPSAIQDENAVGWQIEQLHRELKQLTGTEHCQGRKARSQGNHMAGCYHAWLSLKVKAQHLGKSLSAVQHDLFSDYLRAELPDPRSPAFLNP